jgi:Na+:H+ antiporter, NhaA family
VAYSSNNDLAAGLALMGAAALGVVAANTPAAWLYDSLRDLPVSVRIGDFSIDKTLLLWINDGLMAIFFFFVGLELKREVLAGELSSPARAALPAVCALGGMVVPALIFAWLNWSDAVALRGWAIPAATDIAFALGILALAGKGVPIGVKILLTAIAIVDDLGAIVVIAVFYTEQLSWSALGVSAAAIAVLATMNRMNVVRIAPYALVAVIAWAALLKSGVHATLAGVAASFFIPLSGMAKGEESPLVRLEEDLKPIVAFFIVPLFGFCNAGVSFAGITLDTLLSPVALGIALGLIVGKQIGVFLPAFLMVRFAGSVLPPGTTWRHMYAMSALCGIGFTMSLFIGALAYPGGVMDVPVRLGVIGGSIISAIVGLLLLRAATSPPKAGA